MRDSPTAYGQPVAAFRQGLSEDGLCRGPERGDQYRWVEWQYDRALVDGRLDLVRRQVAVIVASENPRKSGGEGGNDKRFPLSLSRGDDPVNSVCCQPDKAGWKRVGHDPVGLNAGAETAGVGA